MDPTAPRQAHSGSLHGDPAAPARRHPGDPGVRFRHGVGARPHNCAGWVKREHALWACVSMEDDDVRDVLEQIGLILVARNHPMLRSDGSLEGEVDLVFTFEGHTFVIEVSANAQSDARRIKRKRLREWVAGGRLADLSSELGLPAANAIHAIYVDLSGHTSEEPGVFDGGIVLGTMQMDELMQDTESGMDAFLYWNGI